MQLHFNHLIFLAGSLLTCKNDSFTQTVIIDVTENMGTGICDSIPAGSTITNVIVGDVKTISESPTADVLDVGVEFDFIYLDITKHRKTSLIYLKRYSKYKLAAMGDCEYRTVLGDFLEGR